MICGGKDGLRTLRSDGGSLQCSTLVPIHFLDLVTAV